MTMTREEQIKEAARQRADQYDHPSKWSDTYYGFIDGAKWADSHPQWIPVEEELPKEKGKYMFRLSEVKAMVKTIHDLREKVNQLGWRSTSELPPEEGEYIAINNGMPGVFWVDYLEPFGWCVEIMGAHEVVNVKWWCYPPKEDKE